MLSRVLQVQGRAIANVVVWEAEIKPSGLKCGERMNKWMNVWIEAWMSKFNHVEYKNYYHKEQDFIKKHAINWDM